MAGEDAVAGCEASADAGEARASDAGKDLATEKEIQMRFATDEKSDRHR
jgi:hypothetical protein